jgi:divalent metal cation (Fe/Co/Zn/Cd) transporter
VRCANSVLTVQMGPRQGGATLSAEFEDALTTPQIEACINRIEKQAKVTHPEIVSLFIKPQTAETWRARRKAIQQNSNGLAS